MSYTNILILHKAIDMGQNVIYSHAGRFELPSKFHIKYGLLKISNFDRF